MGRAQAPGPTIGAAPIDSDVAIVPIHRGELDAFTVWPPMSVCLVVIIGRGRSSLDPMTGQLMGVLYYRYYHINVQEQKS
jgi:hypothetical protein